MERCGTNGFVRGGHGWIGIRARRFVAPQHFLRKGCASAGRGRAACLPYAALPTGPPLSEPMRDADMPEQILLLGAPAQSLAEPLAALGCTVVARAACHDLVQDAPAADALLLWSDAGELDDWLAALEPLKALPGVCIAAGASLAQRRRALAAGVQVLLDTPPVSTAVLLEQLQWARWQAQRLALLQTQLDERKWTDKAKGLLMAAQDLDEEAAFRLLREAAMHAHLRLGQVALSVVQAAQAAEAINLAGQQRMLSQRLVKLLAQRGAGIEARRAKVLQDESCERVDANLRRLQTLVGAAHAEPLAELGQAWARLRALLGGKPGAALLVEADAAAETLLGLSERLTVAIEAAGTGKPLKVVNLCGRQRMLSQRLAKDALLADLLQRPDAAAAAIGAGLQAFEAGLVELEAAPLSSAEIRALLAEVRDEWLRLLRSLRDVKGAEAAAGLARSSELLLARLDQLTEQYQHSLQLILA